MAKDVPIEIHDSGDKGLWNANVSKPLDVKPLTITLIHFHDIKSSYVFFFLFISIPLCFLYIHQWNSFEGSPYLVHTIYCNKRLPPRRGFSFIHSFIWFRHGNTDLVLFKTYLAIWSITFSIRMNDLWVGTFKCSIVPVSLSLLFIILELPGGIFVLRALPLYKDFLDKALAQLTLFFVQHCLWL